RERPRVARCRRGRGGHGGSASNELLSYVGYRTIARDRFMLRGFVSRCTRRSRMAIPSVFYVIGDALGLSLQSHELGVGQMALRAVFVYVVLVAIARLGHKRLLDRTSAFDIIL